MDGGDRREVDEVEGEAGATFCRAQVAALGLVDFTLRAVGSWGQLSARPDVL